MFGCRGLCEWKLTENGEIIDQGKKWNTISDQILTYMCRGSSTDFGGPSYAIVESGNSINLQLSDTAPDPSVDYRVSGASSSFSVLASSGFESGSYNRTLNTKYHAYNFTPSGVTRTIRVIGVSLNAGGSFQNFISFVELSTPITQTTLQYLYVQYTLYFSFSAGGYNVPDNHYVDWGMNSSLLYGSPLTISNITNAGYRAAYTITTGYMPPDSTNNLMRFPSSQYNIQSYGSNYGSTYSRRHSQSFAVADIPGPIGAIAYGGALNNGNVPPYGYFLSVIHGYSAVDNLAPSVSRVFIHPSNRQDQIFSDPSYVANSQGLVSITGTPTPKFSIVGKIAITKTGDASDIVDESFTSTEVSGNTITVTQSYDGDPNNNRDIVRITTTNTLPAPLSTDTDYYLIWISNTSVQVSASAIGGAITLTDGGTGTHTIIRQITGEYRIELEPYRLATQINQLSMGVDFSNKSMPQQLSSSYDTGEGGTAYVGGPLDLTLVYATAKVGDYLYTIQKSRVGGIYNMCRWKWNTIETSQSLCTIGSSTMTLNRMVGPVGTKLYVATSIGLFVYETATPTVAPTVLVVSGIIDSNIKDVVYDEVTGYLWTGHETGLSKINLGLSTATQYITGTGQQLEGMTANQANIWAGQLDAYNGRILRAGVYNVTNYSNYNQTWVMDDKVGGADWTTSVNSISGGCIRRDSSSIVLRQTSNWYLRDVTTSGKNIGSESGIESYAATSMAYTFGISSVVPLSKSMYSTVIFNANNSHVYTDYYKVGTGAVAGSNIYNSWSEQFVTAAGYSMVKNTVDVDGSGANTYFYGGNHISFPGYAYSYGWNGSAWVKDHTGVRKIPLTGTSNIPDGLEVTFNNKAGTNWDLQFYSGDRFTFMYAPVFVKDNLQTFQFDGRTYHCEAHANTVSHTITDSSGYCYVIDETSNSNFRDMDTFYLSQNIMKDTTRYDRTSSLTTSYTYTANASNDVLTVGADVSTGTPLAFGTTSSYPDPLTADYIYYALRMDTTAIRVSGTYQNAADGSYINLTSAGTGTQTVYPIVPTKGYQYSGLNGHFVFSPEDDNTNVSITYTYTLR